MLKIRKASDAVIHVLARKKTRNRTMREDFGEVGSARYEPAQAPQTTTMCMLSIEVFTKSIFCQVKFKM